MHGHDVDILNDHEISVFDNNAALEGMGGYVVRESNNVLIYDFDNNSLRSPWKSGFEKHDIRTITQGLSEISGDELFVEETNYGRLIQINKNGEITWQYVNRASDGQVYITNWSRIISRDLGDKVMRNLGGVRCK